MILEYLLEIDKKIFFFINGMNNGFFDWLMFYISEKYTWIPLYIVILVLVFRRYKLNGLWFILFVALLVFLSDQSSTFIKNSFLRYRPCQDPELMGLVHTVRNKCAGRFGFVSSHAANTFAVAVFVTGVLKQHSHFIAPVMFTYAVLNSYSRVYVGVHYPGDVIFGALLGAGIGLMIHFIWTKTLHRVESSNR